MTMLATEFATLMLVSGVGADVGTKLADAFRRVEWERNLTVFLRPLDGPSSTGAPPATKSWRLEAEGIDKAGIVAKISRCLAERGILISDLRSHTTPGADAGTPVYRLLMRINAPDTRPEAAGELQRALAAIAEELRIEISLQRDD